MLLYKYLDAVWSPFSHSSSPSLPPPFPFPYLPFQSGYPLPVTSYSPFSHTPLFLPFVSPLPFPSLSIVPYLLFFTVPLP